MAISPEQLSSIIAGRAKTLCQPTVAEQKRINTVQSKEDIGFGTDSTGIGGDSFDTRSAFRDRLKSKGINVDDINSSSEYGNTGYITESVFEKSKLPNAIKEAMKDKIRVAPDNDVATNYQDNDTAQQVTHGGSTPIGAIDYSLLRAIINDCLNNYFSSKGVLEAIQLSGGNITLTDNKGNSYQAKLEKIK